MLYKCKSVFLSFFHPVLLALGEYHTEGHFSGCHRHRITSIFFIRHCGEHGCANQSLRFSRGKIFVKKNPLLETYDLEQRFRVDAGYSFRPVVSDQLGRKNVPREIKDARQGPDDDAQRGAGPNPVHILGQNGHTDAEHNDVQQVQHQWPRVRRRD